MAVGVSVCADLLPDRYLCAFFAPAAVFGLTVAVVSKGNPMRSNLFRCARLVNPSRLPLQASIARLCGFLFEFLEAVPARPISPTIIFGASLTAALARSKFIADGEH
jgi:hypothetical protein